MPPDQFPDPIFAPTFSRPYLCGSCFEHSCRIASRIFNGGAPSREPTGFASPHSSGSANYKQIEELLKNDAVAFDRSRGFRASSTHSKMQTDRRERKSLELSTTLSSSSFTLSATLVPPMRTSTNAHKYKNEVRIADQLTVDCRNSDVHSRLGLSVNQPALAAKVEWWPGGFFLAPSPAVDTPLAAIFLAGDSAGETAS
jgi:hypothetical protein